MKRSINTQCRPVLVSDRSKRISQFAKKNRLSIEDGNYVLYREAMLSRDSVRKLVLPEMRRRVEKEGLFCDFVDSGFSLDGAGKRISRIVFSIT